MEFLAISLSRFFLLGFFLLFFFSPHTAYARKVVELDGEKKPLTFSCIEGVAQQYELPLGALVAILALESGEIGKAYYCEANGSFDLGAFQINTFWMGKFSEPLSHIDIINDGCLNANLAGAILRHELDNVNGDIYSAIKNYHSKTKKFQDIYFSNLLAKVDSINIDKLLSRANKGVHTNVSTK